MCTRTESHYKEKSVRLWQVMRWTLFDLLALTYVFPLKVMRSGILAAILIHGTKQLFEIRKFMIKWWHDAACSWSGRLRRMPLARMLQSIFSAERVCFWKVPLKLVWRHKYATFEVHQKCIVSDAEVLSTIRCIRLISFIYHREMQNIYVTRRARLVHSCLHSLA